MHRKPTTFTAARKRLIAMGAIVVAMFGTLALFAPIGASASVQTPAAGNVIMLPAMQRIFGATNPLILAAGAQTTVAVGGQTFGDVTVPSNATGVTLSVATVGDANATGRGQVRVWTTGALEPGTPALFFDANRGATNLAFVALDSAGKLNIKAVDHSTKIVVGLVNYVTPVPAAAAPTVKTIAKHDPVVINVGGSIRTRATELGSVTLPAGMWDARVLGGWTGLNNVNNTVPAGVTLTGTMILQLGADMGADFENNVTAGAIAIPRSNSDTLTQDPTASISSIITLDEPTEVHVKLFAYADNSSQAGSGELKANLQGAQFVKIG